MTFPRFEAKCVALVFSVQTRSEMPWKTRELSDGRAMPQIALGSWLAGNGPSVTAQIELALETGFTHVGLLSPPRRSYVLTHDAQIDTAQIYRNESEVGDALRGIDRESYFLTTKWSGMDAKSIHDSIHESLDKVRSSLIAIAFPGFKLLHWMDSNTMHQVPSKKPVLTPSRIPAARRQIRRPLSHSLPAFNTRRHSRRVGADALDQGGWIRQIDWSLQF